MIHRRTPASILAVCILIILPFGPLMAQERPGTPAITETPASAALQRIEAAKQSAPTPVQLPNPDFERRLNPARPAQQAKTPAWAVKTDPLLLRAPGVGDRRTAKPIGGGLPARKDRFQDQGGFQTRIKEIEIDGEPHVEGFIRLEPGTDPYAIPGFQVRNVSPDGRIASGFFSRSELPTIANHPQVRKIEPSLLQRPLMQSSRQLVGADQVHLGADLPQAYKGEGVVVGVLDSGIDADNADFSNTGGTRIQNLLEYTADGGFREWTKAQIDADPTAVTQRDGSGGGGHGTHVTGTAAGGGRLNSAFTGMAPESDIVFVKGVRDADSDGGFFQSDITDGVEYIFRKADSLSKPAVVNLSLGSNYGPLDGSSAYEQYLTSLQGEGKIIVIAAGNEGMDYLHTGGDLAANSIYTTVDVPFYDDYYLRNIWYDAGTISHYRVIAIRVEDVAGQSVPYLAAMTDWLEVGSNNSNSARGIKLVDTVAGESAGFIYHNSGNTVDENNGDGQILIEVHDGFNSSLDTDYAWIDRYVWMVLYETTATPGRMDSWGFYAIGYPFEFITVNVEDYGNAINLLADREHSVGTPATAEGVISVGAFVSSNTFSVDGGASYNLSYPTDYSYSDFYQPSVGEIAYFSSRGPTRDGRQAPIVSAPGDRIFATRSQDIATGDLSGFTVESGNYLSMQGTSMAAPHVTGLVALMLQADPTLDYADIVAVFDTTSTVDAQTGAAPNAIHGYGRIDAHAAVAAVAGTTTSSAAFDGWTVALGTKTVRLGETASLPLTTQSVQVSDNLISFQFDLTLPSGVTFVSADTAGTMAGAASGTLLTNQSGSTLSLSFATSTPMTGSGTLIKLNFTGTASQTPYALTPTNVFLNNTQITNVTAGSFTVTEDTKGDIDDDSQILAYDAALVLQYSVGKDPLPTVDPLPWEAWRVAAADIDGDGSVLAADATYILQYTVGILDDFSSFAKVNAPRILIDVTEQAISFSVEETGLVGMNLSLPVIDGVVYGDPVVTADGALDADHVTDGFYHVAIASIASMEGTFLTIPVTVDQETELTVRMRSNATRQTEDIVLISRSTGVGIEPLGGLGIPDRLELHQNYPNPFNPATQIRFGLPAASDVKLEVFDMLGRRVAVLVNGRTLAAGWHEVAFDASGLSSGAYIYRLTTPNSSHIRSFSLIK